MNIRKARSKMVSFPYLTDCLRQDGRCNIYFSGSEGRLLASGETWEQAVASAFDWYTNAQEKYYRSIGLSPQKP